MTRTVVIVEGCRIPFQRAGTTYLDEMAYRLAQFAIRGLLDRTGWSPDRVDGVVLGQVISNVQTPNVAREAALTAGVPPKVPCRTVSQACISANRAIADACLEIAADRANVVIAGGVDSASDTPIGFRKAMRRKLFLAQKNRGLVDNLRFLASLRPADFLPERPRVAEYSTGRTMGQDCDNLAARFGISREAQDTFAVRSHRLAAQARDEGLLRHEIVPVVLPPSFEPIDSDNGIRPDTSLEQAGRLPLAFDRRYGTLTAANSSFLTDGAAAALLMDEQTARSAGLTPKATIVDYVFTGQDLSTDLLLGPTFAIAKLLDRTGTSLADVDVFELHEAFAGQVLANLEALTSDAFARQHLGRDRAVGAIDIDRLNRWGGSLSIGHPFGATGARLLTTTANRLHREKGRLGLLAACAAGGHGHAMLIQRYGT